MRKIIVLLSCACLLAVPVSAFSSENDKNLFVIVTSGDPVTQLMSMVLASESKKKEADVEILLCGQAGALALKDSEEVLLKPKNISPQMMLKNLIHNGVNVEVCPPYLPNVDKTAEDLIDGVSIAKPPQVAEKILDKEIRILTN